MSNEPEIARGPGVNKMNNESIVFDLMCEMTQPIRTTNDQMRKLVKVHRQLDLTYNQMREILKSLYDKGKITNQKEGNVSLISTVLPIDMMSFPQPLEHAESNTPPYVWDWYRIITRDTKHEGISMEEMAKRLFYDAFNPSKFNAASAERLVRKIARGYRKGYYTKKNGMPFDRYIISDTAAFGKGYFIPEDKKEVDEDLRKAKKKALEYWQEYWYKVNLASRDQQIRYVASDNEKMIHSAVKKEMEGIE